jgi:hypothetical protein
LILVSKSFSQKLTSLTGKKKQQNKVWYVQLFFKISFDFFMNPFRKFQLSRVIFYFLAQVDIGGTAYIL